MKHKKEHNVKPVIKNLESMVNDITDSCQYLVYQKWSGGHFYVIQAEQKTCYKQVATYINKKLQISPSNDDVYKVKYDKGIIKVYRRGPMPY